MDRIDETREMTRTTGARATGTTKSVATRSPRQPLVLVALLLMICTEACDGIGSWRKKLTKIEAEDTNDASNSYNKNNSNIDSNSSMDKTYLDLFGESAKELLTQKAPEKIKNVFPDTDEQCRWDWRYVRCEPYCECSFQPKLPGDFHLGRACRKRINFGRRIEDSSENEEIESHFDANDETYRAHCVMEIDNESNISGDLVGQQRSSSPPPLSIPSPFPFLEKSGKATWKILRTKADPVVARAVDEFETMHGRVQDVVCQDLKTRCFDSETPQSSNNNEREEGGNNDITNSSTPMEVAWQERLFCRDAVRECRAITPGQKEETNDRNSER